MREACDSGRAAAQQPITSFGTIDAGMMPTGEERGPDWRRSSAVFSSRIMPKTEDERPRKYGQHSQ